MRATSPLLRARLAVSLRADHNTIHFHDWDEIVRRVVEFTRAATTAG